MDVSTLYCTSQAILQKKFNKICNIIGEYGTPLRNTYASGSYFEEHFEPLIKEKALQTLAEI